MNAQGTRRELFWRTRGYLGFVSMLFVLLTMSSGMARADTAVTVPLADLGQSAWIGNASNASLGEGMQSAGDVNGDGIADLVSSQGGSGSGSTSRGVWVLFTQPGANGSQDLGDVPPSRGYRIRVTNSSLSITSYAALGDQNGDGVPDFLVRRGNNDIYVVYGVADPASDLPKCDPLEVPETRCLDLPALTNLHGDRMGYTISSGYSSDNFAWSVAQGDFDGNGEQQMAIGAGGANIIDADRGAVYIVRNDLGALCPPMPASCGFDFSLLGSDDVVRIDGPFAGTQFGRHLASAGDLNEDGKDDLLASVNASGTIANSVFAVYGRDWQTTPVSTETFGPDAGFRLEGEVGASTQIPADAGDANGDGRPDIAVYGSGLASFPRLSVAYTDAATPSSPVPLVPPDLGKGYLVDSAEAEVLGEDQVGDVLATIGDLNADGFDELTMSNPDATAMSVSDAGSTTIFLGPGPKPPNAPIVLGPDVTADVGLSIVGDAELQEVGGGVAPLGDVDSDGIPDFAVAATDGTGEIFLVRGSSLFGKAITGQAASVSEDGAELGGFANPNGRASEVYFEYGTSDSYGSATAENDIGGSREGRAASTSVTGLNPDTEYHYRLVVENDLGIKSYGSDRTFMTRSSGGGDPCTQDPKRPGCAEYVYCQDPAHAGEKVCQAPAASLSRLIANSRIAKVRRGKKAVVWAWITSTGGKAATGVKVCAKVPKRKAKIVGKRCRNIGNLAPGKTGKAKFKIKVKHKARKRANVKVKLVASAKGVSNNRTARVRFAVR